MKYDPRGLWAETPQQGDWGLGDGGGGCDPLGEADGFLDDIPLLCPQLPEQNAPVRPIPTCEKGLSQRDINYVSNNFIAAFTVGVSTGDVLSAGFILAWAGHEGAFGTSNIALSNDNFFGETDCIPSHVRGQPCHPNADPAHTSTWKGSVPCATESSPTVNTGFACFSGSTLAGSASAALSARGGLYLKTAAGMSGAPVSQIAQAIANAGWCTDSLCNNGQYGQAVLGVYNELVPVIDCLFPWANAQLSK